MKVKAFLAAFLITFYLLPAPHDAYAKMAYPKNFRHAVEKIKEKKWEEAYKSLWLIDAGDNDYVKANTSYLMGYTQLKLGKAKGAKTSFLKASRGKLIGDWALLHLAEIEAQSGSFERLLEISERFITEFPFSPLYDTIAGYKAKGLKGTGNTRGAIAFLENHIEKHKKKKGEYLLEIADSLLETGQTKKAYGRYQEIFYQQPHLPEADKAETEILKLRKKFPESYKPANFGRQLKRIEKLMKERQYPKAIGYINSINTKNLLPAERSKLWLKKGISLKRSQKTKEAIKVYKKIIEMKSKVRERPTALYLLAKIEWNLGNDSKTLKLLSKLIKEYPHHKMAASAYYVTAKIMQNKERYSDALKNYRLAVRKFPKTDTAASSLWNIGWLQYQRGEYGKAEKTFRQFEKKYPFSAHLPKVIYWHAKSLDMQKKNSGYIYDKLKKNFRYSYYTLLADKKMEGGLYKNVSKPIKVKKSFGIINKYKIEKQIIPYKKEPPLNAKQKWMLNSARNWIEIGFMERSTDLIKIVDKKLPNTTKNLLFLSYFNYKGNNFEQTLKKFWRVTGKKTNDEQANQLITLLMFPVPYWNAIARESEKYGIDPLLVLSIMRQESLFNSDVVSRADAHGLMQIIPPTGKRIFEKIYLEEFKLEKLHEPEIAIKMGAFHLADLLKSSKNDLVLAIASYNAGRRAVKKWTKRFPLNDMEKFIEKIPYPETRGYVKKVLRNYGIYKKMYKEMVGVEIAMSKE